MNDTAWQGSESTNWYVVSHEETNHLCSKCGELLFTQRRKSFGTPMLVAWGNWDVTCAKCGTENKIRLEHWTSEGLQAVPWPEDVNE
jgi:hypothetical protein